MNPQAVVNINSTLYDFSKNQGEQAKVSVFDRSYLYGDSLYEVVRTYNRKPFQMDAHLDRLVASSKLAKMELGQTAAEYSRQIQRTLDAYYANGPRGEKGEEAYCRLVVSRGTGRIGFGKQMVDTSTTFTIIVQPLDPPNAEQFEKGLNLYLAERWRNHPRALDPAMKSGNYLNSLLAYLEAQENHCDDAILCDFEGHVTEGTTFNVFYVKRGIVATSPLDIGILDGITRRGVISCALKTGIPVREVRFPIERLLSADEVFMSSTIKEVFPITQLNGKPVANGKPGPITRKLKNEFQTFVRNSR